jgi:hypothetical protein
MDTRNFTVFHHDNGWLGSMKPWPSSRQPKAQSGFSLHLPGSARNRVVLRVLATADQPISMPATAVEKPSKAHRHRRCRTRPGSARPRPQPAHRSAGDSSCFREHLKPRLDCLWTSGLLRALRALDRAKFVGKTIWLIPIPKIGPATARAAKGRKNHKNRA